MSETANARANYTATAPYPRSVRVGPKSLEVGPKPKVLSLREADLFAIREAGVTLERVPTTEEAAAGVTSEFSATVADWTPRKLSAFEEIPDAAPSAAAAAETAKPKRSAK